MFNRRTCWTDYSAAAKWFEAMHAGQVNQRPDLIVKFLNFALNETRFEDVLSASELLIFEDWSDDLGIPYEIRALVCRSLAFCRLGEIAEAWAEGCRAIDRIYELALTEADIDLTDLAFCAALDASAGATRDVEALEYRSRHVSFRESTWGALDSRTLRSKHNQALELDRAGKHPEAAILMESVIRDRRRSLGYEHSSTVNSTIMLPQIWARADELEKAIWLAEQIKYEVLEVCGVDDARSFEAGDNWAMIAARLGDTDDAINMLKVELQELQIAQIEESVKRALEAMLAEHIRLIQNEEI